MSSRCTLGRWLNWLDPSINGMACNMFFFFSIRLPLMSVWLKKFFPSFPLLFCKTLLVCLFDAQNKHSGNFSLSSPRCFGGNGNLASLSREQSSSLNCKWSASLSQISPTVLPWAKIYFFFFSAQKFTVRILHAISSFKLKSEGLYWFFIWVSRWIFLTSVASIWK